MHERLGFVPACLSCGFEPEQVCTFDPECGAKPVPAAPGALEQALDRFEGRENLVSAQRARTRLATLEEAAPR